MENGVWTATKVCPDRSYDGEWYFYEDIGQLAPKWLPAGQAEKPQSGNPAQCEPEPAKPEPGKPEPARPEPGKPELDKPQSVFIAFASDQRKGQIFNSLYPDMKKSLEEAYTADQDIQKFNWSSLEGFTLTSKDEKGNERTIGMKDLLPSKEAVQPLLTQSEMCNALAVKLSLEDPYQKLADQTGKRLSRAAWHALSQQLESEIGEAENQANATELDATQRFADIDKDFSALALTTRPRQIEFQATRDNYTALLDKIVENLKQSRLLASQIKGLEINPFNFGP